MTSPGSLCARIPLICAITMVLDLFQDGTSRRSLEPLRTTCVGASRVATPPTLPRREREMPADECDKPPLPKHQPHRLPSSPKCGAARPPFFVLALWWRGHTRPQPT